MFASGLVLTACSTSNGGSQPISTTVVYGFGVVRNLGAVNQLQLDRSTRFRGISGRIMQIATSNSEGYALTSRVR